MLRNYKICLITLFLFGENNLIRAQYESCKTPSDPPPNNLDGVCVTREECKTINDILTRNKSPPAPILIYLVKADCGTYNGQRFLCCKTQYLSSEIRNKLNDEKSTPLSFLRRGRISDEEKEENILDHPNRRLLPDNCQSIPLLLDSRISNGNDASLGEFLFIALMGYESLDGSKPSFYCAGSLISEKYILTAAHCTDIEGIILKSVRLGEYNLDTDPDCNNDEEYCDNQIQNIPVTEIIKHENFELKTFLNDIALLRLAYAVNLHVRNVAPICLPIYPELQKRNIKDGIVIGWGSTEKRLTSSILQKASFPIIDRYRCRNMYRRYNIPILDSHFCAGGKNNVDACRGDSGGPLFSVEKYEKNIIPRYIQYGIVSGGTSLCGTVSFPGLYTNVTFYMNWILNKLKD